MKNLEESIRPQANAPASHWEVMKSHPDPGQTYLRCFAGLAIFAVGASVSFSALSNIINDFDSTTLGFFVVFGSIGGWLSWLGGSILFHKPACRLVLHNRQSGAFEYQLWSYADALKRLHQIQARKEDIDQLDEKIDKCTSINLSQSLAIGFALLLIYGLYTGPSDST